MFLSNGNRDLGVTFEVHPGSQASSQEEAKNSALVSSCDGYLLELIEWPKGSQASYGDLKEASRLLSRPCRKRRASSHERGGISCFVFFVVVLFFVFFFELLCKCVVSHEVQRRIQGASRVAPRKSSLH